ncbi:baseplate J/gp47 family protein [Sulfurimonas sp.]|uniref:baseplate J/gp47 family protein n=1 Tax=Sulfurimonas sp. TaxID=2022749 RepID=UPI002B477E93|nr:baseplate J/gp47 family protein [Sulfurimonas sp.]
MLNNKYNLPIPTAIEVLNFEKILQDNVAYASELLPNWQPVESDDYMILLESQSNKEVYFRAYINSLIKKMLPHYSNGADLDNFIFGFYAGITRLKDEEDAEFLDRAILSVNRFSTAGPIEAYAYHTYKADSRVVDAKVINAIKPLSEYVPLFVVQDEAGILAALMQLMGDMATVEIYIASKNTVDEELLQIILTTLNEEKTRPLTDRVIVKSATIKEVVLDATLEVYDLTASATIETQIRINFNKFFKIGEDLIYSKIISSLHINGVYKVTTNINDDVVIKDTEIVKLTLNLNLVQREMR